MYLTSKGCSLSHVVQREGRFNSVSLDFPHPASVSLCGHTKPLCWNLRLLDCDEACVCVGVGGGVCLGTLCSPSSLLQWYFPAKRFVFFSFYAGHDYNEGDDDKAFIIRFSAVSNPKALILNYSLYIFCSTLFCIGGGLCVCMWITVSVFFFLRWVICGQATVFEPHVLALSAPAASFRSQSLVRSLLTLGNAFTGLGSTQREANGCMRTRAVVTTQDEQCQIEDKLR